MVVPVPTKLSTMGSPPCTCVNACDILNVTRQLEWSLCIDYPRCCFLISLPQPWLVRNNEQQPRLTPLLCLPLALAEIPQVCVPALLCRLAFSP